MTITSISQTQLDDIDACMVYLATLNAKLRDFSFHLESGSNYRVKRAVVLPVRTLERLNTSWNMKASPGLFRHMRDFVQEGLDFLNYLVEQSAITGGSRTEAAAHRWNNIPSPPLPLPQYASGSMDNCLAWLEHHRHWVWQLAEISQFALSTYQGMRTTLYSSLTRVIDFMSLNRQLAVLNNPAHQGIARAAAIEAEARQHYAFAMSGIADFLVMNQRITLLLNQAHKSFNVLDGQSSVMKAVAHLRLIMIELEQARRHCDEVASLRG